MDQYFDVTRGCAQAREQEIGQTLLLVVLGHSIILEMILIRRRTLAHGSTRTRCRTEWATDDPLSLMFLLFVSAPFDLLLFLCSNNFYSLSFKFNQLYPPVM